MYPSNVVELGKSARKHALLLVLLGVVALVGLLVLLMLIGADMGYLHTASVPTGHHIAATTGDVRIGNGS